MVIKRMTLAAVIVAVALPSVPVVAQIEEVIVTSRKRDETIMDVPVVTSVLAGDMLRQYETGDLSKISDSVAGLNLGSAAAAFGAQVSLRGVGTSALNATLDQSVALNIDGMQMTQGLAYAVGMFDMAQVEVLKGPQALLFGKASPGGVISIRTNDPAAEFEASATVGYEYEAEEEVVELILSGPVSDTLGLRLVSKFSDAEGYFKNAGEALPGLGGADPKSQDTPSRESTLLRATAVWEPSYAFNARLKVNYSETDIEGAGWDGQMGSCPDGNEQSSLIGVFDVLYGPDFAFLSPKDNCRIDDTTYAVALDPDQFPGIKNGGVPFNNSDQFFTTLEWNYEVAEELILTSLTGYYDLEQDSMINGTATTYAGPFFILNSGLSREDVTQEFRLTSDYDSPVNYMIGVLYQDAEMLFHADLPSNAAFGLLGFPDLLLNVDHTVDVETQSMFGQVLWNFSEEWELGAGVRWTHEQRTHRQFDILTGTAADLANPELDSENWSPELTLSYMPSDELTLFTNIKQAYKSGSFDSSGQFDDGQDASFGDERVRGVEFGLKSRLMDGRLLVNAATYYYKYRDLQVSRNEVQGASLIQRTVNAASSEVHGVDADFVYQAASVDGLVLHGAMNWNSAKYEDFDNAKCWGGQTVDQGCNRPPLDPIATLPNGLPNAEFGNFTAQDLSGESLLRAPEWSANLGFDYQMLLPNDLLLVFGMTASYSSEYLTNILARDDMWQDAYTKTNASISLRGPEDKWEIALLGTNLEDEVITGNCTNGNFQDSTQAVIPSVVTGGANKGPGGDDELLCTAEPGRTLWARMTLRF